MTEQMIAAAIRSSREARGISLRGLAGRLGVSPATMSALERGRTPITIQRLRQIAELLDVPATRLLNGEGAAPADVPQSTDWRHFDELDLGPVLEAAARLFVRHGFHATSVREIAADAGVSVAGIYHHHPSKHHLLVALMDLTMSEIRWRLLRAKEAGASPEQSLGLMVESLALFHAMRGDLAFLGASEMRGIEEPDLARITALRDEVQHLIDDAATVAFPGHDVRTACRAITTMCTSLPSWFRLDGRLSAAQVAREYAELGLAMVRVSPADI